MKDAARWSVERWCALRDWGVTPGSVGFVLTDTPDADTPPEAYHELAVAAERWLGAEDELAVAAERWLGAEGFCAVGCCPGRMPEVLGALDDGPLQYVWTMVLAGGSVGERSAAAAEPFQIRSCFRPLVMLRKGKIRFREWTADWFSYDWRPNGRELHTWRPDVSPLQKLIRVATEAGAVVADPFCGPGAETGIAALSTGRRFVGGDRDAAAVEGARTRLQRLSAGRGGGPKHHPRRAAGTRTTAASRSNFSK